MVLALTERLPEDAEDAEGAEDTDAPAEEGPDSSGDETDETDETEEPDTGPPEGNEIPKHIEIDCPVCSGTGLLQKKSCEA